MKIDNKNVSSWLPQTPLEAFNKKELMKLKIWGQEDTFNLLMRWFFKQLEFNMLMALGKPEEERNKLIKEAEALKTAMQMVESLPHLADAKLESFPKEEASVTEEIK